MSSPHRLFEVFGIELEYALVRRDDLKVAPVADRLLSALGGSPDSHPVLGNVEADNELAAHVLEMKCRVPASDLVSQARDFAGFVALANRTLLPLGARLMPAGMHPFMDPVRESRLWPHDDGEIYAAYDKVFDCRGHGWFNIQSVHLNLPFSGDAEFSALHNAVSLLLPILPALAAASPVYDGRHHGWLDGRIFHYQHNQRRLPAIIGPLVPEPAGSEAEYRERILAPMYAQIAPLDPDGLLQEEWLNSRAAIARFERSAIEIRCLDTQEHPGADLALCHFIASVLKRMLGSGVDLLARHRRVPEGLLRALFLETARVGRAAALPAEFPRDVFGVGAASTAGAFLGALVEAVRPSWTGAESAAFGPALDLILREGNLAERILRAAPDPAGYPAAYARLCDCLEEGRPFLPLGPEALVFREATAGDLDSLLDMIDGCFPGADLAAAREELEAACAPSLYRPCYVVAVEGGVALAMAGYVSSWIDFETYELFWVAVRSGHQSRGLGSRIVAETLARIGRIEGRSRPCRVLLSTDSPGFFAKLGFERISRSPKDGGALMCLKLD